MADEQRVFHLLKDLKEVEYDVRGGRLAEFDLPRFVTLCKQLKLGSFGKFSATLFPANPNVGGGMDGAYTRIDGTDGDISTYKVSRVKRGTPRWQDELRRKPRRAPGIYVSFKGEDSTTLCKLVNKLLQLSESCECREVYSDGDVWRVEVQFSLVEKRD